MRIRLVLFLAILTVALHAADLPTAKPGDYVIKDFKFSTGQTLPELRIHYRTFGEPKKDAAGKTTNAVLILHGGVERTSSMLISPEYCSRRAACWMPRSTTS